MELRFDLPEVLVFLEDRDFWEADMLLVLVEGRRADRETDPLPVRRNCGFLLALSSPRCLRRL